MIQNNPYLFGNQSSVYTVPAIVADDRYRADMAAKTKTTTVTSGEQPFYGSEFINTSPPQGYLMRQPEPAPQVPKDNYYGEDMMDEGYSSSNGPV